MSAVLWKFIRVFDGDTELSEEECSNVAAALKLVQSYVEVDEGARTGSDKEEEARREVHVAYDHLSELRFRDSRLDAEAPDVHMNDVVFTLRRKLVRDDFISMNLPIEFWDKYQVPDAIAEVLRTYVRSLSSNLTDGIGLYLYGQSNRGKSSAASALAQVVRSYAHSVFFVTISDLREMIRNRIEFSADQLALERCKQIKFLVLDNLREEDAKEHIVNALVLEDIFRFRASMKRPTLLTSRMSPALLQEHFHGVYEVINASALILAVKGPDLRESAQLQIQKRFGITPQAKK